MHTLHYITLPYITLHYYTKIHTYIKLYIYKHVMLTCLLFDNSLLVLFPIFLTLSLFSMSGTPSRAQPWRILRIAISPKGVDQTLVELLPTNLDYFGVSINAGYPQVIIHFIFVFSLITHTFWGTPIYGTPHFMVQWLKFSCFNTGNLVPEVACHGVL